MTQYKYLCNETHFTGAQLFVKGKVYLFSADPGAKFSLTDREEFIPAPNFGYTDTDGTYYPGPVNYIDFTFPVTQGKQGANIKPDYDYDNIGYLFPDADPTEIIYVSQKLPAGMRLAPDSCVYPHSHFVQTAADQVPNLIGDFRIVCDGDTYNGFTTVEPIGTLFPYTSGNMLQVLLFPPFNLWDIGVRTIGGSVEVKGYRGADDIVGDVLVKSFGMWIPMDSFGSGQPHIK